MRSLRLIFRRHSIRIWAVVIAFALWFQVHGSGVGAVGIDVALQVQGLSHNMMIVNDMPDRVRVTLSGLRARLDHLGKDDVHITLDVSNITKPGVVDRAISIQDIQLPAGMTVEKIQPDHLQLQVDRVRTRSVPVRAVVDIPEQWKVDHLVMDPVEVKVMGPEVWLDALSDVETETLRPALQAGPFTLDSRVVIPTGKAIHIINGEVKVKVSGVLTLNPATPQATPQPKEIKNK